MLLKFLNIFKYESLIAHRILFKYFWYLHSLYLFFYTDSCLLSGAGFDTPHCKPQSRICYSEWCAYQPCRRQENQDSGIFGMSDPAFFIVINFCADFVIVYFFLTYRSFYGLLVSFFIQFSLNFSKLFCFYVSQSVCPCLKGLQQSHTKNISGFTESHLRTISNYIKLYVK